jgi:flagellar basal-body rod modification protein FlgD
VTIDPVTGGASEPMLGNVRSDGMGRDAFLALLVTQLQHQNPLEPKADGEFLAQLAQFSSLENLQEIKQDMAALRSLIETGVSAPADGGQ